MEAVLERLEVLGYSCFYEPDSDIPGGWHCDRNGGPSVGFGGDEAGPILSAGALMLDESAPGKEAMDARAATVFRDNVLSALLPEAVLPSDEELLTMVQRNWPVELEDGWVLGFDRASNQRTLHVRYVEPGRGRLTRDRQLPCALEHVRPGRRALLVMGLGCRVISLG